MSTSTSTIYNAIDGVAPKKPTSTRTCKDSYSYSIEGVPNYSNRYNRNLNIFATPYTETIDSILVFVSRTTRRIQSYLFRTIAYPHFYHT